MSDRMTHSVARAWVNHRIALMMKDQMKEIFGGIGPGTRLHPQDKDTCFDIYLSLIDQFETNRLSLEERLKYEIE